MDITTYCKNPRLYTNLPSDTRKFYDGICKTRKSLSLSWDKQLKRFGIGIAEAPEKIISNILSPEGLEMLGIFTGVDLTSKAALNGILRGIARGVGPEVMELAAEQAVESGAFFINNVIITSVLSGAIEEGTAAAAAFSVTEAVASGVSSAASAIIIIQFLGLLVDLWDPSGYSQELNGETMDIINNEFDIAFANKFLEAMTVGRDRFGRPIHFGQLPIEYRMDAELIGSEEAENIEYQKKLYQYTFEYLNNLEYNSDGHAMKPRILGGELLDENIFQNFANSFWVILENQNTEVIKWSRNNVLILAISLGIILWLILRKW